MAELTAEQKIRQTLTGSPFGEPNFQHEGSEVVHVLSGGSLPRAWVTFHERGELLEARCAGCKAIIGHIPANREPDETVRQITAIQLAGHEGHMPADWPFMNITNRRTGLE